MDGGCYNQRGAAGRLLIRAACACTPCGTVSCGQDWLGAAGGTSRAARQSPPTETRRYLRLRRARPNAAAAARRRRGARAHSHGACLGVGARVWEVWKGVGRCEGLLRGNSCATSLHLRHRCWALLRNIPVPAQQPTEVQSLYLCATRAVITPPECARLCVHECCSNSPPLRSRRFHKLTLPSSSYRSRTCTTKVWRQGSHKPAQRCKVPRFERGRLSLPRPRNRPSP